MLSELLAELYAHPCHELTFQAEYKKAGGSGDAKVKSVNAWRCVKRFVNCFYEIFM